MKWFFEFAVQKPSEEFFLYFFVFVASHVVLEHVQERSDAPHDEL